MDNLDFSEEEIQEQLAILGYRNIPKHRLLEFKQDLDELIRHGEWQSLASETQINSKTQMVNSRSSPPAYTKEKVSQHYFIDSGKGFFLHTDKVDHDRTLCTTSENRKHLWQKGTYDSYAQHSVAAEVQLPPGGPSMLQDESDSEDTLDSPLSDSYTSTPDMQQQRRFIKRKVLRKHQGQSLVCEESFYSEDSDAASCLEEQVAELNLSASPQQEFEEASEVTSDQSDTWSSETDSMPLSAFESYVRASAQTESDGSFRPKPKSFIRPVMSQRKKTDPVAKYFQYKQLWEMFKLPGERDRKAIRSKIKERLAYQPPPPKPRRVYMPSTYVVPTAKKRSALCWQIRNDLANGFLPHRGN